MSFDVQVYDRDFTKKGITGVVTKEIPVDLEYPCIKLYKPDDGGFQKSKLVLLKNMLVNSGSSASVPIRDQDLQALTVYVQKSTGDFNKAGKILPTQIKSFLKLFEDCKVEAELAETKLVTGKYLLALASF